MTKPLAPTEKRKRQQAALIKSLTPRKQDNFNGPINIGPLNVRRATGQNASI